jgi:DNA-binding CsgD family transcriptional regulator
MVDASGRAMLLVDGHLRILRASPSALRHLDHHDGLRVHHGILAISDLATADAVRETVRATIDRRPIARSAFLCHRPSGRASYRLNVLPAGTAGKDGALIVIEDPASAYSEVQNLRAIRDAYGLTPAEQAIAEGLLRGKNLEEIANERAVGRETVRTQLKSLFDKTGTNRQAELVRLLSRG